MSRSPGIWASIPGCLCLSWGNSKSSCVKVQLVVLAVAATQRTGEIQLPSYKHPSSCIAADVLLTYSPRSECDCIASWKGFGTMLLSALCYHHNSSHMLLLCHHLLLQFAYGPNLVRFPNGGSLFKSTLNNVAGKGQSVPGTHASLGWVKSGKGLVFVMGDNNCLDSSHMVRRGSRVSGC